MKYEAIAPCLFGMEATVSFELKNMGIKVLNVSDGRVTFEGDAFEIVRAIYPLELLKEFYSK